MSGRLFILASAALLAVSCSQDPRDAAREYVESGDRFTQEGRHDAALIQYRNAVKDWPTWTEAHEKVGDALARLGRTEEGYRAYAAASRIVGEETLPYEEDRLRQVVAERPRSVAARVALAQALLSSEQPEEAEEQLLAAAAVEPENELTNRGLAAVFFQSGRVEEAERRLTIAAGQTPQRYRSRLALADFLLSQARYAESRTILEQLRSDRLLAGEVGLRLAAVDYNEGAVEAAHRTVSELLETDETPQAWTLQAEFLSRESKFPEALVAVRKALALDPHFGPAVDLVRDIREKQLRLRPTLSAPGTAPRSTAAVNRP